LPIRGVKATIGPNGGHVMGPFDAVLASASTDASLLGLLAALVTLATLEIVLGVDNLVFIAILTGRLAEDRQARARTVGLILAMFMRLGLLAIAWLVIRIEQGLFAIPFIHETIHDPDTGGAITRAVSVSVKDLVMLGGGLFLIAKATWEIHELLEGDQEGEGAGRAAPTMGSVLFQIMLLDLVFSLDSVITAVGMTKTYWVMATAVVIAVGVMLFFAGPLARFVKRHPTMKTLALAFLVLIGVLLVAAGLHQEFDRRYVYFAMAFALGVELINLRAGARRRARRAGDVTRLDGT
jgi:predicted tellurium resistance membrane protein TerC